MKLSFYSTALSMGIVLALVGCADPSDSTPDAKVEEAKVVTEAPASEGTVYTITDASSVGFVGSKVTGSHDGGFKTFSGTVTVPDGDLSKASIKAKIDMNSVFTDNDGLTKHLSSPDFFDVAAHPESTFESTAIEASGEGYTITGNFTFHGVTKSINFPATLTMESDMVKANAEFDINRFDFGVEYPGKVDDLIRENVVIKLDIQAGV